MYPVMIPVLATLYICCMIPGCKNDNTRELYHFFQNNSWNRYNKLSFELPVGDPGEPADVIFFGNFTPEYSYNTLDFNMILKTPSGEERINEYQMKVKNTDGTFLGKPTKSGYYIEMTLKSQLNPGKTGKMILEIENLIPRLVTTGIEGVGVRLIPSGK